MVESCSIVGQIIILRTATPGATAEYGFAHDCILHSMRVEEDNGTILPSNVINALSYCISNKF